MSTPKRKANGTWTLLVHFSGKRRNLTLGRITAAKAEDFRFNIDCLMEHVRSEAKLLPRRLQVWVSELDETHKTQLSELGLFDYRSAGMTVEQLTKEYVSEYSKRTDITAS
ncbi:MAG: hypothetical protein AAFX06_25535 [Planctomycetota bacterium]